MVNKHRGSTFDSFLSEEGLLESVEAVAIKRVISYELEHAMEKKHLSKAEMAAKMHTSRSALDRLLDPSNTSVTLHSIIKAAHALGRKVEMRWTAE